MDLDLARQLAADRRTRLLRQAELTRLTRGSRVRLRRTPVVPLRSRRSGPPPDERFGDLPTAG